jgi:hypothetical protein
MRPISLRRRSLLCQTFRPRSKAICAGVSSEVHCGVLARGPRPQPMRVPETATAGNPPLATRCDMRDNGSNVSYSFDTDSSLHGLPTAAGWPAMIPGRNGACWRTGRAAHPPGRCLPSPSVGAAALECRAKPHRGILSATDGHTACVVRHFGVSVSATIKPPVSSDSRPTSSTRPL